MSSIPFSTYIEPALHAPGTGSKLLYPQSPGDQGIQPSESRTATQMTRELLAAPGTQLVATVRDSTYELRSADGYVQWQRYAQPDGTMAYQQTAAHGKPVVASVDARALPTLADEIAAAGGPQLPVSIEAESMPDLVRRVTQIFDSPRAGDMVVIPKPGSSPDLPFKRSFHGSLSEAIAEQSMWVSN